MQISNDQNKGKRIHARLEPSQKKLGPVGSGLFSAGGIRQLSQRIRAALHQEIQRINIEVMPEFRSDKLQEAAQLAQRELDTLDIKGLEKNIQQERGKALAKVNSEVDATFTNMLHRELSGMEEAQIFELVNEAANKGDVQFMTAIEALPWWSKVSRTIKKWSDANPQMLKLAEPSTPHLDKLNSYYDLVASEKAMSQNAVDAIAGQPVLTEVV